MMRIRKKASRRILNKITINGVSYNNTSSVCVEAFHDLLTNYINKSISINKVYLELHLILKDIKKFKRSNNFDKTMFPRYMKMRSNEIPFEIIWWLVRYRLVSFMGYSFSVQPEEIANSIINIYKSKTLYSLTIIKEVLHELLLKNYQSVYTSHNFAKQEVLNYYIRTLNVILDNSVSTLFTDNEDFINFIPIVNSITFIPHKMKIKYFYKSILTKILTCESDNCDINSCYLYQEMWKSSMTDTILASVYFEIFKNCSFIDIIDIIETKAENLNWKHVLQAISNYFKIQRNEERNIKDYIKRCIKKSFRKQNRELLVKTIIVVRQISIEMTTTITYEEWYSSFCYHYDFIVTDQDFLFLFKTFEELIKFETKKYLETHIQQVLYLPYPYKHMKRNFRSLCLSRLHQLLEHPEIQIDSINVNIFQAIEECVRMHSITEIVKKIKETDKDIFYKFVVANLLNKEEPFATFNFLLKRESYPNEFYYFEKQHE